MYPNRHSLDSESGYESYGDTEGLLNQNEKQLKVASKSRMRFKFIVPSLMACLFIIVVIQGVMLVRATKINRALLLSPRKSLRPFSTTSS